MMLSKITNHAFALMLVGAMILTISIFKNDNAESALRSLHGRLFPYSSTHKAGERKLEGRTGCGLSHKENACNANQDERGNECRWCADPIHNFVCVADDSMGYKFAPCNKWTCYNEEEPEKSDVTACERVMV